MTLFHKLRRDRDGMVSIEFALVFVILIMLSFGAMELAIATLIDASMEAAVREASRIGSVSVKSEAERETKIRETVKSIMSSWFPGDTEVSIEMKVYPSLDKIGSTATWTDSDGDGFCDPGEGDCTGDKLTLGAGKEGDLVYYRITAGRPDYTGILKMAGVTQWTFTRQTFVLNE